MIITKSYKSYKTLHVSSEKISVSYTEKNICYYEEPKDLSQNNIKIIERKKSLKNKRKPMDILIYTNGSLISADAVFKKNF